jgi:hypothetical protein
MRNPLLAFLLHHLVYGLVGAAVFAGGALATDLGGLRTLVWNAPEGPLAMALLLFGLAVTFGSVAMGVAVMRHGPPR